MQIALCTQTPLIVAVINGCERPRNLVRDLFQTICVLYKHYFTKYGEQFFIICCISFFMVYSENQLFNNYQLF